MKLTRSVMVSLLAAMLVVALRAATAQDSGKVDPRHYKVVFENSRVRVLRVTYGPHAESVKEDRPGAAAVLVNDSLVRLRFPNEKTAGSTSEADDVRGTPPGKHLSEEIGSTPVELLRVELK